MGVPSLDDLAVNGTLNTTNQPKKLANVFFQYYLSIYEKEALKVDDSNHKIELSFSGENEFQKQ